MNQYKSFIYILPAIVFWSTAPVIVKLFLNNIDIYQIIFLMCLLASICLYVIMLIMKRTHIIHQYHRSDYLHFALMGFFGIFLYFQFFFFGFFLTSAQETYVLNYTWPIWMICFTIILSKDKMKMRNIMSIILGFCGVLLIITKGNFLAFSASNLLGYIFALLSAICYGLFSAIGKNEDRDPISSMFFYFLFSSVYAFIFLCLFSNLPILSIWESTAIFWLGICSCALAFVFWFKALHYGKTSLLANIVYITPFFSLFFIYIFIVEQIQITSFFGLMIIALSIFIEKEDINYSVESY